MKKMKILRWKKIYMYCTSILNVCNSVITCAVERIKNNPFLHNIYNVRSVSTILYWNVSIIGIETNTFHLVLCVSIWNTFIDWKISQTVSLLQCFSFLCFNYYSVVIGIDYAHVYKAHLILLHCSMNISTNRTMSSGFWAGPYNSKCIYITYTTLYF